MDFTDLFPFAPEVGYVGLGLVSFFGSLIPFVPIPSFLLLATMSVGNQFDIHILALLSAITTTVAKQIIFTVSYTGRRIITEKTKQRMMPFQRLVKRYGGAAAFVAAATPIPDDLVYIPLGLAKYNPKRFFLATLSGKIILSYVIVLVSHFLGISLVEPYLEQIENPLTVYIGFIVFGIALTAIVILMFKLDWHKILGKAAPWTLYDENDENNPKS
ncbi:MAG TPA: VTT domain-containing protein [Nitrosopumilaceae archaeon]|nr:VTT domain-containing protein [Nitrosopumilaceae archaeon]